MLKKCINWSTNPSMPPRALIKCFTVADNREERFVPCLIPQKKCLIRKKCNRWSFCFAMFGFAQPHAAELIRRFKVFFLFFSSSSSAAFSVFLSHISSRGSFEHMRLTSSPPIVDLNAFLSHLRGSKQILERSEGQQKKLLWMHQTQAAIHSHGFFICIKLKPLWSFSRTDFDASKSGIIRYLPQSKNLNWKWYDRKIDFKENERWTCSCVNCTCAWRHGRGSIKISEKGYQHLLFA